MSERTISVGDVVGITYTLTDADSGEELDRISASEPFAYLHGTGSVVRGLEAGLTGLSVGSAFDLTLEPVDAYGERKGPGPQVVKRSEFRRDAPIRAGMRFTMKSSAGVEVALWVTKVAGSRVYVDSEHPLVGRRVRYAGQVALVRDASEVERQHGHAHGPHGHDHH